MKHIKKSKVLKMIQKSCKGLKVDRYNYKAYSELLNIKDYLTTTKDQYITPAFYDEIEMQIAAL